MYEMDAIRCKEWRLFPGLSMLSNKLGYIVFLFARIPLFFIVYRQLTHSTNIVYFIRGCNIFMMAHLGLHIFFLPHKNNLFKAWISWAIIAGAGFCGFIALLL